MFTVRRLVVTLVAGVALFLLVASFSLMKETDPTLAITDSAVKSVFPANGELDLRQSTIGFELRPEYTGRLEVDARPIPDDQVRFVIGQNRFVYTPGPGTETGQLRPGLHHARAIFWRLGQTERQGRTLPWSFNVH